MHSQIKWLIPVALSCVAFGSNIQSAKAQTNTIKEFEITYDALTVIAPIENQPGFFTANIAGTSQDNSPFGLTKFESNAFGKLVSQETIIDENGNIVSEVQKLEFNANPDILGLANPPQSVIDRRIELGIPNPEENSDIYFGDSVNKLFGKAADQATLNLFPPGSSEPSTISGGGTITITGGTGIFKNASGEITFEQSDQLPEDPTAPALGKAILKFSLKTPQQVPEPTSAFGLAGGIVGTGLILGRKRRKFIN